MGRLIRRRLLVSILLLWLISFLTFMLQSAAPGDAAQWMLGENYDPVRYEQLREQMGLDRPVLVQYWDWFTSAIRGDLGVSPISRVDVSRAVSDRLPVTLSLMLVGTLAVTILGVGLGLVAAVRGGRVGRMVDAFSLVGHAIPNFWLALILITLFAVGLGWFPATGYVRLSDSPADWARSLALPVAAIAFASIASLTKHTRDRMLDALSQEYVRFLRANGASETSIVFRHGLRNAAIPVVTIIGLTFIGLFSGAVVVESIFALPGMGRLTIEAAARRDLPMLQGVVVSVTLVVVVVNLLVDIAYGWLNPRARLA